MIAGGQVRIDPTTLADLELLRAADGGPGILALVDRTQTRRGHAALRELLAAPRATLSEVREAQSAVRFFAEHPGVLRIPDEALRSVERYIDSNLALIERPPWGDRIAEIGLRLRYPEVHREIREGVTHTRSLFRHLMGTCGELLGLDPPAAIRSSAERVCAAAESVLRPESQPRLLPSDRAYRGPLRPLIAGALEAVVELDLWCSQGAFAASVDWAYPEFVDSREFLIEAEGLLHPLLQAGVGNPVRLTGGAPMVFLTGPNMAGKTTYLRTVGLLVALAQVGLPVPASRARLTPVKGLFSSLNPSDDLRAGLSTFMAEVQRVRDAAELLLQGRSALVLFDEVFRGTNVKDALEASAEVIAGFARARNAGFIFSSHLSELADVLEKEEGIRFAYFDGEIRSGVPRYPYRLEEGVSDKCFGMALLRQARIPELIARLGSSTAA